jgi:TonB family protein
MNHKNILRAAILAAGVLSASIASAALAVDSIATARVESNTAPTPLTIVAPSGIPRRFQNETIRLSLTIDESGRPRNIELLSGRDAALVRHLLPAVAQWKFSPATKNGRAVATDVVLPIELVDGKEF